MPLRQLCASEPQDTRALCPGLLARSVESLLCGPDRKPTFSLLATRVLTTDHRVMLAATRPGLGMLTHDGDGRDPQWLR
jgi:hypothetical protein